MIDADAGKSQKVAPQNSEYYEVLLSKGEEHQVQLVGHWQATSDSLVISVENYDKEYMLSQTACEGKVTAEIYGMWLPGKPGIAYSYEDFIEF